MQARARGALDIRIHNQPANHAPVLYCCVVQVLGRKIVRRVVQLSGLPCFWDGQYQPPPSLLTRAHEYVGILASIMELPQLPASTAELLQGEAIALLLKSIGNTLAKRDDNNEAPAGAGAARAQQQQQGGGAGGGNSMQLSGVAAEKLQGLRALVVLMHLLREHLGSHALQVCMRVSRGFRVGVLLARQHRVVEEAAASLGDLVRRAVLAVVVLLRSCCHQSKPPQLTVCCPSPWPPCCPCHNLLCCTCRPTVHIPQLMAVLSESLIYCTHGPPRLQALTAWLCFVQLLAKHAPQVLERVAAQAAVVLLPVLEPADTQVIRVEWGCE